MAQDVHYNRAWDVTIDGAEPSPNLWRPDPGLRTDNIHFRAVIAHGGFGPVFEIENTETNNRYAMKMNDMHDESDRPPGHEDYDYSGAIFYGPQGRAAATRMYNHYHALPAAQLKKAGGADALGGDLDEAAAKAQGNEIAWLYPEVRVYLHHIRSGHPNIVALEAFQVTKLAGGGVNMYYELCDAGNLQHFAREYWNNDEMIPEAFIWKVYEQFMSALAFLHRTHPQYQEDEVRDRLVVVHTDLVARNIFLKYPNGNRKNWPDLMIGDIGEALFFVPPSEKTLLSAEDPMHNNVWAPGILSSDFYGPEAPEVSDKADVWAAGANIHFLVHRGLCPIPIDQDKAHSGVAPFDTQHPGMHLDWKKKMIHPFPPFYSKKLSAAVSENLVMDPNKRPTAGRMWTRIISDDYKGKPSWPGLPPSPPGWYTVANAMEPMHWNPGLNLGREIFQMLILHRTRR